LFQLAASTLPTKETESGLLPTPTTQDNPQMKGNPEHPKRGTTLGGYARMFPTPAAADSKGTTGGGQNSSLRTHVRMFPTPTANEDAAGTPNGKMQKMLGNHPAVRGTTKEEWASGMLNPTWVEWLMGYPKEWTELKD
jgi:DNA (cytosine-5)-methyltransferase 1